MCKVTNIKNLPEGTYFTEVGYTQLYPWKLVKSTPMTATLVRVRVKADDWKPEIIVGGFAGHCINQNEQTWEFDGVDMSGTRTIRKTKKGWSHLGVRFLEDQARYFYDYNF